MDFTELDLLVDQDPRVRRQVFDYHSTQGHFGHGPVNQRFMAFEQQMNGNARSAYINSFLMANPNYQAPCAPTNVQQNQCNQPAYSRNEGVRRALIAGGASGIGLIALAAFGDEIKEPVRHFLEYGCATGVAASVLGGVYSLLTRR